VRKRAATRAGENGSLNETVVAEGIVEDEVAWAEEMAERRLIRAVTRHEHDRILCADPRGYCRFKLHVKRDLSRDRAARGDRRSIAIDRILGRSGNCGVAGHPDIVVAREVDDVSISD
jgi:hypothetical protein